MNITEDLKNYALAKADKLSKYFDRLNKIEVILDHNKNNFSAEMIISAPRGATVVGHVSDTSCQAALDFLTDKMERQLTKLKEKMKMHRRLTKVDRMGTQGPVVEQEKEESGGLEQHDWY